MGGINIYVYKNVFMWYYMFMSKSAETLKSLPGSTLKALAALGENLRIARERRGESLRSWALRMAVSVPTLQRMESGDPSVGMGVYAVALWLCGQEKALAALASPSEDKQVLELEIIRAAKRRKR